MDGANGNCDEEKENEEGVADIVPGVEVEEDAGTIQLPEETRQFLPFKSLIFVQMAIDLFLSHFHQTRCHHNVTLAAKTCSQQLPGPGSSPLRSKGLIQWVK